METVRVLRVALALSPQRRLSIFLGHTDVAVGGVGIQGWLKAVCWERELTY